MIETNVTKSVLDTLYTYALFQVLNQKSLENEFSKKFCTETTLMFENKKKQRWIPIGTDEIKTVILYLRVLPFATYICFCRASLKMIYPIMSIYSV